MKRAPRHYGYFSAKALAFVTLFVLLSGCNNGLFHGSAPGREVQLASGQEHSIAALLGRGVSLPEGCSLGPLNVAPRQIEATYPCTAGSFVLELVVDQNLDASVRSQRFVFTPRTTLPDSVVTAVRARLREGENSLNWEFVPEPALEESQHGGASVTPNDHAQNTLSERRSFSTATSTRGTTNHGVVLITPLALVLALVFLFVVLRRQLRQEPHWMPWALTAVTALGAVLRVAIAQTAPMNAFAFDRVLPLSAALFDGPVVRAVSALTHRPVYLTDVIAGTNLALSFITPPLFFAHARYLLRDARSALVAAALIALLPMHLRFALSDVQFITSLVTSSFTFVVLYGALGDSSPRWRSLCFVLLPVLSLGTYLTRPENIVFAALDLGALTLYLRTGTTPKRLALAFGIIASAAALSVFTNLLAHYGHNVSSGLSLDTLRAALRVALDPQLDTLVNPAITPPIVPVMALLGAVTLWRSGDRARTVFLTVWLTVFFVVHSYVVPRTAAMQARYHLHLVTPLLLLAAASTPFWLARHRLVALIPALWMLAAPFVHLPFERDVNYIEMHEASFLRGERDRLGGCTVLEFNPYILGSGDAVRSASRVRRITNRVHANVYGTATVLELGERTEGSLDEHFALSDRTLGALPRCTYYYEGATCVGYGHHGGLAAPCEAVHQRLSLTVVATKSFQWHWYDDTIAGRMWVDDRGITHMSPLLPEGTPVTVKLYRVENLRR